MINTKRVYVYSVSQVYVIPFERRQLENLCLSESLDRLIQIVWDTLPPITFVVVSSHHLYNKLEEIVQTRGFANDILAKNKITGNDVNEILNKYGKLIYFHEQIAAKPDALFTHDFLKEL